MSSEEEKKVGRPKSDLPTKTIRVPEVLIPMIENLVEAFKTIKKEDSK
jgi:hypothetical protein